VCDQSSIGWKKKILTARQTLEQEVAAERDRIRQAFDPSTVET